MGGVAGASGIEYHRQLIPHQRLQLNHPEYSYHLCNNTNLIPDDKLKEFQAVQFIRLVSMQGNTASIMNRFRRLGIKIVLDVDDYWVLDKDHALKKTYDEQYIGQQTVEAIRLADVVTTTTKELAYRITEHNRNVEILKNCLDPDEGQWKSKATERPRIGFGWVGGIYHLYDMMTLVPAFKKAHGDNEMYHKGQLVLGGYHANMEYMAIEGMMTDKGNFLRQTDKAYWEYLVQNENFGDHYGTDKPYRRIWGRDVYHYGTLYDEMDVCLVPLRSTPFTACKSELKLVEAGMKGKAVIASDVLPYSPHLKGKGMACTSAIDFYAAMRRLIRNPNQIADYGAALKEYITADYDIHKETEKRKQIYEHLLT